MTVGEPARQQSWDPPGPGTWTLDTVHVPRPASAHMQEMFPAFSEGFAATAKSYGWLIDQFNLRAINGFLYSNIAIVDFEEMPDRFAQAERAFATKQWRAEVERWDNVLRPATLNLHREMLAVDVDDVEDAMLIDYLHRCRDHHYAMWRQHHRFNGTHMVAVGDFISAAAGWTGLPAGRIAGLLRGASPISRGWGAETEALVVAINASATAKAVLDDRSNEDELVDRLRGVDDVAPILDEWLLLTANRPVEGFDITYPCGHELPRVLAQCIRTALRDQQPAILASEIAAVRDLVPEQHRSDFDDRYEEAKYCYHVRDERGIYNDALACGIARRAFLAAGRRLAARRVLPAAELALDASVDELATLLTDGDATLAKELSRRAAYRTTTTIADAPPFLGDPPSGPPALDGLPPAAGRMMHAVITANSTASPPQTESASVDGKVIQGIGATQGTYRGTARIVSGTDDFERLEPGDVMVTITTGEAFNVAIAMAGALITDQGNIMCHAAITSREFGIPAVVGAAGATSAIPDGATVEVDGETGVVRWT